MTTVVCEKVGEVGLAKVVEVGEENLMTEFDGTWPVRAGQTLE